MGNGVDYHEEINLRFNELYEKHVNGVNKPAFLCHYTDVNGLEGILRRRCIWMTDMVFMNDPDEMKLWAVMYRRALIESRAHAEGIQKEFLSYTIELLSDERFQDHLAPPFCAAFSGKRDDLSQYRAYANGGEGYCLVFDCKAIQHCLRNVGASDLLDLFPVIYKPATQSLLMQELVKKALELISSLQNRSGLTQTKHLVAYPLQQFVSGWAPVFKNEGFEAEAEWRIVPVCRYMGQLLDPRLNDALKARKKGNALVRYFELPLTDDNGYLSALREIIVGPKFSKPEGIVHGIHALVRETLEDARVRRPEITISKIALQ